MIHLIFLEIFKLRKALLLSSALISLLLLSALLFRQYDEPPGLVYLTLTGIVMLYAVYVGWKQFRPSRFPILGDDSLSARHPLVSVIARWGAYVLTVGVMLLWTIGLLWWCLAAPEHTSRPFDPDEIKGILEFWLIPLLLLYGFSALLAQMRGLSRSLWAIAGIVIIFSLLIKTQFLFSVAGQEFYPISRSAIVIMLVVCLALFGRVALASTQKATLTLNSVNSVILSCLILFPSIFAIGGWLTAAVIQSATTKGTDQWTPVIDTGVSKMTHSSYSVTGNLDVIEHMGYSKEVVAAAGVAEDRKARTGWTVDEATGVRSITFSPVPRLLPGDEVESLGAGSKSVLRKGIQLQLSADEKLGLVETMKQGQKLVDFWQVTIRTIDPDSTQELKWVQQKAGLGTDRIFWNRQERRFELYGRHPRRLISYVSADISGKFLGYEAITSPQRSMIVSFESGAWSLTKSGRKLFLTQLYSAPSSQRLLNVVKHHNHPDLKDRIWPVLTDHSFSIYQSEITEDNRVGYLTNIPGLKTAVQVEVWSSPWHGGLVVIMMQRNTGLKHYEILRYDAAGALVSQSQTASEAVGVGFGVSFGAILSPLVHNSAPYGSFGIRPLANTHRPQLKTSAWMLGIAFNIVTILLMLGLIHRIKPGKRVAKTWIACAVVFSLPTLLMFLIWMPWRERMERKRINREHNPGECLADA